jgi:hypothetical protein
MAHVGDNYPCDVHINTSTNQQTQPLDVNLFIHKVISQIH